MESLLAIETARRLALAPLNTMFLRSGVLAKPVSSLRHVGEFASLFEALTGNLPYPWQEKLFGLFLSGTIPANIDLPTGSGKTSIIPIWLLALAEQAAQNSRGISLPRRLVWVVNRRVVVDQATDEAEEIRKRLGDREGQPALDLLRVSLRKLSLPGTNADLIAISTLRGEKEDNREWSDDPSRPAIIVGTVDMVGSRLLFSGYGNGLYWRAHHAGLLGQDSLIVNDEAHLTPAFATLLKNIERAQEKKLKPFRTLRLSATHTQSGDRWPDSLDDDRANERFRKTFEAEKQLQIHVLPAGKQEAKRIQLAIEPGPMRTIIFVRQPEKARKLAAELAEKLGSKERILTLTGTMRGFERDQMIEHDVFRAFSKPEIPKEPCFMIATAAGEVGINISADRLITDLDTVDHLLQRFGRLNRFGETVGQAHMLLSEAEEKDEDNKPVLEFLRNKLPVTQDGRIDISPAVLFGLELPAAACSEQPLQASLHDWLVETWSQTSLGSHPMRFPVEPWLHGKQDEYPETYIAWREDVRYLVDESIGDDQREDVLDKYPVLAHEKLQEPTRSLLDKLRTLCESPDRDVGVLRCKSDGSVDVLNLREIGTAPGNFDGTRKAVAKIAYCQLILPIGCGRLENGMFSPEWAPEVNGASVLPSEAEPEDSVRYDVSGFQTVRKEKGLEYIEARSCFLSMRSVGTNEWSLKRLGYLPGKGCRPQVLEPFDGSIRDFAEENGWQFPPLKVEPEREGDSETEPSLLLYYFRKARPQANATSTLFLKDHLSDVGRMARELGQQLGLEPHLLQALELAGKFHDVGKGELIWQAAARNIDRQGGLIRGTAVAKPIAPMRGRDLGGFRHELASLRLAKEELEKLNVSAELADLVLHLIGTHHGHGRPCFQEKSYDRNQLRNSAVLALEAAQRFGRLQEYYGAWELAYLETILRAADGLASQYAQEQPANA
jgi:CRISPR-associated endonuclease/helicase Cas3